MTRILEHTMDLTDNISAYVTRIERLEADLTRERAISARLATLKGPKPEDIPAPDSFDGNRANLRPFVTKLRMKIAGNATKFPDIQHQLRYAFGFLKGDAYATIEPCQILSSGDDGRRSGRHRR